MSNQISIDFPYFQWVSLLSELFSCPASITWMKDVDAASKVVHRRDEQSETKVEDLMSMQNLDRIERLQKLERQGKKQPR